ncbi:MAG TPA: hypothetical protein VEG27_05760 [Usitatibacter sp.]|nr:hypothetical protein [Usitatibacter sp.]
MRSLSRRLLGPLCLLAATGAAAQLSIDPPSPTSLDTVRLRYTHTGCTNADSVRVSQDSNRITVQVDRGPVANPDCGTVAGFFEEFTLGRLPVGEYDASLVVNPPPGTLGPSQLLGPIHVSVAQLASGGLPAPSDDYTDMWWNPREPGWALTVSQYTDKLFLVWVTYDDSNQPTWFVVPGGAWSRDSDNHLHFGGKAYRTSGPSWKLPFDAAAVRIAPAGIADFSPLDASHAVFTYTIDGVSGLKMVERWRF